MADEAEESFGVVDGGGVDEGGDKLGEGPDGADHHPPGNPAEVVRPRRPLHEAAAAHRG